MQQTRYRLSFEQEISGDGLSTVFGTSFFEDCTRGTVSEEKSRNSRRCRKKSHETAEQHSNLLGLGPKTEKHEKSVCGERAKYVTHKGSNAFPEKATIAEHHWQIDFGRGSGEAISYRSALEYFGKKIQEESRKGRTAL